MKSLTGLRALIAKSSLTGRWALKVWGTASLASLVLFVSTIHDFLAINQPVPANILVVEAWAWKSAAMQEAVGEFKRGKYDVLLTVGVIPREQEKGPRQDDSARRVAERLCSLGVDDKVIKVLAVHNVDRHRTYTFALAVRQWLGDSTLDPLGINVFTLGVHARKSLVLYKRALGQGVPVGVIAGTTDRYDPQRWWLSTIGIYTVLRRTVDYLYAEWWPLPANFISPTVK